MSAPSLLLTADGSPTLLDARGVAYHSRLGALSESEYVYLQSSRLAERLASGVQVHVLEIGLGTGLNFVLTAQMAAKYPQAQMHYTAYEPFPLDKQLLNAFYAELPQLDTHWVEAMQECTMQGQLGNVSWDFQYKPWVDVAYQQQTDIIYYDAFGPKDAPELWSPDVLLHTAQLLKPGGCLVTFSVTGLIRRHLAAQGFVCERLPGFGHKRHMLRVSPRE